jgi:hypothetical protein
MLVLAIRKSDGAVMPLRQDSPHHKPGSVARNTARQFEGLPEDYREWTAPGKEKERYLCAKELRWDEHAGRVEAVPYSGEEREERERGNRKAAVENEMIQTQMTIDAAQKLGLDATERRAKLSRLKAQHDEIKSREKAYVSEANIR